MYALATNLDLLLVGLASPMRYSQTGHFGAIPCFELLVAQSAVRVPQCATWLSTFIHTCRSKIKERGRGEGSRGTMSVGKSSSTAISAICTSCEKDEMLMCARSKATDRVGDIYFQHRNT